MADAFKTLSELTTMNDARNAPRDISDLLNKAPFLQVVAADTCPDTTHYYTKYTAAPAVGFRAVNDGRENTKSTDSQVTVTLKILDATFAVDKALADAYKGGPDAYVQMEAVRSLQQAFFVAEKQIWYGTVHGDSGGFSGLANESDLNNAADARIINAAGTTAGTASSVFAVRVTGDNNGLAFITGKSGNINIGDTSIARIAGSSTGTYPAYYTPITGWAGLQRGGTYSVARIANLTEDSGKGLTDTLLAKLLELFPSDEPPTHFVMNRRSRRQLQLSRTTYNPLGLPAPRPSEYEGIPFIITDSIINTETLLA